MKKFLLGLLLPLLLTGCAAQETLETVSDGSVQQVSAQMQQVIVQLPDEAAAPVMESENGKLYICDYYTVSRQILPSGDLEKTVKRVSGFQRDALKIMQTEWDNATRYDFVWSAASESGDQICRACILDDGNYHYVLSASAQAAYGAQLQQTWREMFDSFRLVDADMPIDTGS